MNTSAVKTRFAPSPTGEMHFGNARTALFNVLAAIANNGKFLLRIEDTDSERSSEQYEQLIYKDLIWLGLDWQEGAHEIGDHPNGQRQERGTQGPYHQSARSEIYNKYYQELLDSNKAYKCFCTEAQLALSRKLQRAQGLPPRYTGACANLTEEEVQARLEQGQQPTIRFRVIDRQDVHNKDKAVTFTDIVKGEQSFKYHDIGDFIIRRANGTASFMFCNAIDDALMQVSTVLRGEDHLTNTPRQLMILQALNLPTPEYGHISLIVGNDGSPLSKRHGSKSINQLRAQGFLPTAIVNYLARLGHVYDNNLKYCSLKKLGEYFNYKNLSSSPAHYDEQHLEYWQKEAVLNIDRQDFIKWLEQYDKDILLNCSKYKHIHEQDPEYVYNHFIDLMQANITFSKEAKSWSNILFTDSNQYTDEALLILKQAGEAFFQEAVDYIKQHRHSSSQYDNKDLLKSLTEHLKIKFNIKGKQLFMPIRVSLTYVEHGPELVNLVNLMGIDKVLSRLEQVVKIIK